MSWTSIRPVGARILIKLDRRRDTYGSIVIPDTCKRQQVTGVIVAVGPDAKGFEVGMAILTGKWNGSPIDPPEHDPEGEYFMLGADFERRGEKLAVPNQGHRHLPYHPDVYALIVGMTEDERIREFWH